LPSSNITKTYVAKVNKIDFVDEDFRKLMNGIKLDDGYVTKKAHEVKLLKKNDKYSHVRLSISEGKKNQVKRMFLALGCQVIELQRIAIGGFKIHLVPHIGEYIVVSPGDIKKYLIKK
jgi:pseudouridine synthase